MRGAARLAGVPTATGTLIEAPTTAAIARAVDRLRSGELVAFPTETVYGLGADALNPDAVRRIFAVKGRPRNIRSSSTSRMPRIVEWAPGPRRRDATRRDVLARPVDTVLPGPRGADIVTGGQDTIGLRVPSHPVALALLAAFGGGIAAPSANRFGRISPTTARHVADDLGEVVALILDGGACEVGIESTIVAFEDDDPVLLRPGKITGAELARVLGRAARAPDATMPRAPGLLPLLYAPRTPATLVAAGALRTAIEQRGERDEDVAVLARTVARPADFPGMWIQAPAGAAAYAHDLYANLRALDAAHADAIFVEALPDDDAWFAERDRLTRATRGEADDRD
jgi:L-threonylcarbamoyladenylate synthase